MSSNILVFGGSKNVGYYAALRFLAGGAHVTFLLRSSTGFDQDETIQGFIKTGKAHIVKGDALQQDDVKQAWNEAANHGPVDLVVFTVGGVPSFHPLRGFILTPANLVTRCFANVLCTIPDQEPQPKIIAITSVGISRASHASLPFALKPVYSLLLAAAHKDKLGVERLAAHVAGWNWDSKKDGDIKEDILGGPDWPKREGLPAQGSLRHILIIRPALFTDGDCEAEKKDGKQYRISEEELRGWTVSRKDVAHFIYEAVTKRWQEFENKRVNIAY